MRAALGATYDDHSRLIGKHYGFQTRTIFSKPGFRVWTPSNPGFGFGFGFCNFEEKKTSGPCIWRVSLKELRENASLDPMTEPCITAEERNCHHSLFVVYHSV